MTEAFRPDRRNALAALGAAGLFVLAPGAASAREVDPLIARPPLGFSPLNRPGVVVKVEAKGAYSSMMQPNLLWPKPEVARNLVERALMDLTGRSNATEAMKRFVSPQDTVAIKVNGIAGQTGHTVATNFEVILPIVEAILGVGVPAEKVRVYEQYPSYLYGCRVNVGKNRLPPGVLFGTHNNVDAAMDERAVYRGIMTRYCRFLTEATAVIAVTMMKDHSICGFTGALKNITHGNILNPHDHHDHQASPQIAVLYQHPIVKSRVRLHLTDAFKIIYDKGPLDKDPRTRAPHGAVYASTDPVALDRIGWRVIDEERVKRGGVTLARALREPQYIRHAAELGLGVFDENDIRLQRTVI